MGWWHCWYWIRAEHEWVIGCVSVGRERLEASVCNARWETLAIWLCVFRKWCLNSLYPLCAVSQNYGILILIQNSMFLLSLLDILRINFLYKVWEHRQQYRKVFLLYLHTCTHACKHNRYTYHTYTKIKHYIDNSAQKHHYCHTETEFLVIFFSLFGLERRISESLAHACALCGVLKLITASFSNSSTPGWWIMQSDVLGQR